MKPLPVYIGWDGRESLPYHVFAHSILRRSSIPVAITPIMQAPLRAKELYWRERDAGAATEFSLTRFLVPYLQDYRGLALFADCDMLMQTDVAELLEIAEEQRLLHGDGPALLCAQHDYVPKAATKMDGQVQSAYPRKNWSSFMLMDTAKCTGLNPHVVSTATPAVLHRFMWLGNERHLRVGSLPLSWNWLCGEYSYDPTSDMPWTAPIGDLWYETKTPPKNLHFTEGGPWFERYANVDHADLWRAELEDMTGGQLREWHRTT